jgi:AraC-like DNA-binding protein
VGLPAVRNSKAKRFATLPSAAGILTRLACARAEAAGIDVDPLLRKAGLTGRQIKDRRARLSVQSQIRFLNLAADALRDEFLGFHLAQDPDLREIGLLYYVLASSEVLGDALQRAARYSTMANEGVSLTYLEGNEVAIAFDYVGVARHSDRHQIEGLVTALVRTCRQLTGRRLFPVRVTFAHRRNGDASELTSFLGCPARFGADADEVAFPAAAKQMPVVSADPYLNELLTAYCEEALARRRKDGGALRSRVENAAVPLLPHGKARADEIAHKLGMSQRTLARRLAAEGMSFAEVLDDLKSDLARRYLDDAHLSISQIAWLVGYQEVSAFTHAFKRWTGKTPREMRARADVVRQATRNSLSP